jgi:putative ABC transport system permease protein
METLLQDIKQSLRIFAQNPAFALAAVAALTLGIGVNTAIFSVVNAVLLRPIAVPDPDRVVMLVTTAPEGPLALSSPAKFQHFRQQTSVVRDVAAFRSGVVNFTGGSFPEQLWSGQVTADFFRLFGASAARGRTFTADEDRPKGERVCVLSHSFWSRRFNRDPGILGKAISLSGEPYTVVGVLREFDFVEFGPAPQVWVPFQLDPYTADQGHYFVSAGRLKPGVTLEQAKARLALSAQEFRRKFPDLFRPVDSFTLQPVRDVLVSDARASLLVLAGAVAFVLLIACANVANLLLVRATARHREMAIRAAIGGSRGRIIRQLLTESTLLSLLGGALGLILGVTGIRALLAINTAGLPRLGQDGSLVTVDWRVLGFTLAVSLLTGILFGLIPALQSSRGDLAASLKEGGGRSGTGFRQNKARSLLVVTEIALALVLLIASALLIRTAVTLNQVEPGFVAQNVLTMRMSLTGPRFEKTETVVQLVRDGAERLRAVPGVMTASATCCLPLSGGYQLPFRIVGRPAEGQFTGESGWTAVSPGYFEVFKIPVKRGRSFTDRDDSHSPAVAVINEAMARQYWPQGGPQGGPQGNPLGSRLSIGRGFMREFETEPERQIIGVVGDTRDDGLNSDPAPRMYVPQAQVPDAANALNLRISPIAWVVRTRVEPQSLSGAIQEQLRQATGLPVSNVQSMEEVVSLSTSRQRFNMWLMTVFGVSALLLAAIGIYGLMTYSVEQRTQEIGIRLALGAQAAQVKNMVVLQGMVLTLAGVALGVAGAWGLARFLAAFLFGVAARDPAVFIGVPVLLSAVALLAVWLPARRASRVDPIIALRYE